MVQLEPKNDLWKLLSSPSHWPFDEKKVGDRKTGDGKNYKGGFQYELVSVNKHSSLLRVSVAGDVVDEF